MAKIYKVVQIDTRRPAHRSPGRPQPVVDLLEATMIDPIDEVEAIHAAAERRGYMDDASVTELVRIAKTDLERRRGVA